MTVFLLCFSLFLRNLQWRIQPSTFFSFHLLSRLSQNNWIVNIVFIFLRNPWKFFKVMLWLRMLVLIISGCWLFGLFTLTFFISKQPACSSCRDENSFCKFLLFLLLQVSLQLNILVFYHWSFNLNLIFQNLLRRCFWHRFSKSWLLPCKLYKLWNNSKSNDYHNCWMNYEPKNEKDKHNERSSNPKSWIVFLQILQVKFCWVQTCSVLRVWRSVGKINKHCTYWSINVSHFIFIIVFENESKNDLWWFSFR